MRPLTLELEGFRSHESRTRISFEDRTLIAIVGPTGAGKSSLLDAISYALYGKTPRVKSGVRRLICSRCSAAHVFLRFSVDGSIYEVTRALPRTGAGEHVLVDRSSGDRFIGADEVTNKVTDLLGLDFDAFCSSVLLAQGRFARFLDAAPTERIKILKGIFRLEQIDELRKSAKARMADLKLGLAEIEGELRTIPENAEDLLEEARAAAARASTRAHELAAAVPRERELLEAARSASVELESAGQERARASARREQLPDASELRALGAEEKRVEADLAAAEKVLAAATTRAQERRAAAHALESEIGAERDLFEARADAANRRDVERELEDTRGLASAEEGALAALEAELGAAKSAEVSALGGLSERREQRRAAEREHAAHALRASLSPGEPCPVCAQEVARVPSRRAPKALASLERAEGRAEKAVEQARAEVARALGELDRARVRLEHLGAELDGFVARIKLLDERIEASVGVTEDPGAEIERRLGLWTETRKDLQAGLEELDAARSDRERSAAAAEGFAVRRRTVAAALIGLAGQVGVEPPGVDDRVDGLVERGEALAAALSESSARLEQEERSARTRVEEAGAKVARLRLELRLRESEPIEAVLGRARAEAAVGEERGRELEKKISRARELAVEETRLATRRTLFERLAEDLTDKNFTHFLLEERRRVLSELASARLEAMTNRYRFDDEGDFNVVDELDGNKVREVVTLSGGETFLASLALALALAEAVARHGGRLQSFFLDEGFGSLDAESLDLALDGIERIVGPDRLIALVSHVPALAARIEDRIELDKTAGGTSLVAGGVSLPLGPPAP